MKLLAPRYFLMRVTRLGPLVPAMLFWSDHGPHDPPDNALDRGRLSVYPRAAIAGEEVPPEQLLARLINPYSGGDQAALPWQVIERLQRAEPPAPTHWKFCQPVSEAVYRYHFDHLRWSEKNARNNPALQPRKAIDPRQMHLPSFERENAYR